MMLKFKGLKNSHEDTKARRFTKPLPYIFPMFLFFSLSSCMAPHPKGTFGHDLQFLNKHKEIVILKTGNAKIAVAGDYQGRVMTSTSEGNKGRSYGWVNHGFIATGKSSKNNHMAGGEDRLWFGPEYGKFALFFQPGAPMTSAHVIVPKTIDSEPFDLIDKSKTSVTFGKTISLTNYQNFEFKIEVERTLSIKNRNEIERDLGFPLKEGIESVGFQSSNRIKNVGPIDWSKKTGLLSIWNLGMFPSSQAITGVIPTKNSLQEATSYWSEVGIDRLQVKNGIVFYKVDGNHLHKIGIPPKHTLPFFGSYDAHNKVLTIIKFSFHNDSTYVNSIWDEQENPFGGDVINIFNAGQLETGERLGRFYELESSSSAKALKVGESMTHVHATYHFEGAESLLNEIAEKILQVSLLDITNALP